MRFLYLVPFLLPNPALACGTRDVGEYVEASFNIILLLLVPTAFLFFCWLLVLRFLPSNKGVSFTQILHKHYKWLVIILAVIIILGIAVPLYFSQPPSYVDRNGMTWHAAC